MKKIGYIFLLVSSSIFGRESNCELNDLYSSYQNAALEISRTEDKSNISEFNRVWAEVFFEELEKKQCNESPFKCTVYAETIALFKSIGDFKRALDLCNNLLSLDCKGLNLRDFYFDRALIAYQLWKNNELSETKAIELFELAMQNINRVGQISEAISFLHVYDIMLTEMSMSLDRIDVLKESLLYFESLNDQQFIDLKNRIGRYDPSFLPDYFVKRYVDANFDSKSNEDVIINDQFLSKLKRIDYDLATIEIAKRQFSDRCAYAVYFVQNFKSLEPTKNWLTQAVEVASILQECELSGAAIEMYETALIKLETVGRLDDYKKILKLQKRLKKEIK